MASNPEFVSAGSSFRISTKPIEISFSKWEELIGDNFERFSPDVPEGPTQVNCFFNVKTMEWVILAGHFAPIAPDLVRSAPWKTPLNEGH